MCMECHSYPHRSGCPNAPAAKREIVGYCDVCDKPIYDEDCGFEIGAYKYHYGCALRDLTSGDVLEILGINPVVMRG